MQALIQSLAHMVMALAVAAFAHFGVTLKDSPCPKAPASVQRISYDHPAVRRVAPPLAKDARPV